MRKKRCWPRKRNSAHSLRNQRTASISALPTENFWSDRRLARYNGAYPDGFCRVLSAAPKLAPLTWRQPRAMAGRESGSCSRRCCGGLQLCRRPDNGRQRTCKQVEKREGRGYDKLLGISHLRVFAYGGGWAYNRSRPAGQDDNPGLGVVTARFGRCFLDSRYSARRWT